MGSSRGIHISVRWRRLFAARCWSARSLAGWAATRSPFSFRESPRPRLRRAPRPSSGEYAGWRPSGGAPRSRSRPARASPSSPSTRAAPPTCSSRQTSRCIRRSAAAGAASAFTTRRIANATTRACSANSRTGFAPPSPSPDSCPTSNRWRKSEAAASWPSRRSPGMREPDGRIALPAEFLGAAERFGIVTAIDRAIIAAAFDALAAARKKISPELEIGVNLSGLDFDDDTLVADISRMARAKGIRPERVTFEITETAALRDFDRVRDFTLALTGEGFHFALDDFGMGFSSFRYLRELPVSSLKLDISYVRDLPKVKANRVFVRGIAGICRGLGVKTVAEGVESEDVMEILPELGVDRAQGWHVGYPSPDLPIVEAGASLILPRRPRL